MLTDGTSSIANKSTDVDLVKSPVKEKARAAPLTLIVKPDCMSQGRGIFLTNDLNQIPDEESMII
jgi:hypothetical protein